MERCWAGWVGLGWAGRAGWAEWRRAEMVRARPARGIGNRAGGHGPVGGSLGTQGATQARLGSPRLKPEPFQSIDQPFEMAGLSPIARRLPLLTTTPWPQPQPHASTSTAHLRWASSSSSAPAPSTPTQIDQEALTRESHGSTTGRHQHMHPRDRLRFTRAPGDSSEAEEAERVDPSHDHSTDNAHSSNLNGWQSLLNGDQTITKPRGPPTGESDQLQLIPSSVSNQAEADGGLPFPSSQPFPLPRVPFSTHKFVNHLEAFSIPRGQAEQVMSATLSLLLSRELRARQELLSRQDLDNQAYLFTAALAELKTGSEVKARQDNAMLGSMKSGLERETEILSQRVKEDVQRLHSDIQVSTTTTQTNTTRLADHSRFG